MCVLVFIEFVAAIGVLSSYLLRQQLITQSAGLIVVLSSVSTLPGKSKCFVVHWWPTSDLCNWTQSTSFSCSFVTLHSPLASFKSPSTLCLCRLFRREIFLSNTTTLSKSSRIQNQPLSPSLLLLFVLSACSHIQLQQKERRTICKHLCSSDFSLLLVFDKYNMSSVHSASYLHLENKHKALCLSLKVFPYAYLFGYIL